MLKLVVTVIIIACSVITAQQDTQKPCSSPNARQFDFWIGEWKAEFATSDTTRSEGTNVVKVLWDGCVIEENFDGNPGTPLIGRSYSVYNPAKDKWYQTWVDNYGSYLDFEGGFKDGKMILVTEREDKEGKKYLMRMVWHNVKEDSFDWNWERSDDNGATWEPKWIINYTRN